MPGEIGIYYSLDKGREEEHGWIIRLDNLESLFQLKQFYELLRLGCVHKTFHSIQALKSIWKLPLNQMAFATLLFCLSMFSKLYQEIKWLLITEVLNLHVLKFHGTNTGNFGRQWERNSWWSRSAQKTNFSFLTEMQGLFFASKWWVRVFQWRGNYCSLHRKSCRREINYLSCQK